ncbi:MAG: hypothetical protein NTV92_07900 [Candidatus Bipolaricaulota bacterium]|nr:hypothetical protein [Candidatus Bipolaricaulota bacterium]
MSDVVPLAISAVATGIAFGSLVVAERARRLARIDHRKGVELRFRFEPDKRSTHGILVIENLGDAALDTEIEVHIDPKDDDRYGSADSKLFWTLCRRIYPGQPQRWSHSFATVLGEMGYRADCIFLVRFVGSYWRSSSGRRFPRAHLQTYQVSPGPGEWFFVEQSDTDSYYADQHPREVLARSGIPVDLRKR